ncbi:MAG: hypothetical protein M1819_006846 [Sarea resinae]|nr:MAG: hypothetical protein M1819_006846 [Sarea resinae]
MARYAKLELVSFPDYHRFRRTGNPDLQTVHVYEGGSIIQFGPHDPEPDFSDGAFQSQLAVIEPAERALAQQPRREVEEEYYEQYDEDEDTLSNDDEDPDGNDVVLKEEIHVDHRAQREVVQTPTSADVDIESSSANEASSDDMAEPMVPKLSVPAFDQPAGPNEDIPAAESKLSMSSPILLPILVAPKQDGSAVKPKPRVSSLNPAAENFHVLDSTMAPKDANVIIG